MDTSPRSRAPPPSPAARERPESSEDDDLDRFMKHALRVPNLILPDRIVQREIVVRNPPEIDWGSLISPLSEKSVARELRSSAAAIGCVQLVNHGIPRDLIEEAAVAAADAFGTTPEEKKKAARSPERRWGFDVEDDDEESFWWDGSSLEEMAGISKWNSNGFRDKMERLWLDMEKICNKIMEILKDKNMHNIEKEVNEQVSYFCVHKHCEVGDKNYENKNYYKEKHEMMMMLRVLMRSWGCSHGLALHVPSNATTFQVYFKERWLSFTPNKDALVLTLGDQLQWWLLQACHWKTSDLPPK
ncbi:uncharacterized protein LOC120259362 isoform X2 [Dioscorea cayenensis subsp. rotundata]|uniref:Uncharacterized protein LOC120259362 isoform X2 n=1 Tax=Dioscorea cayennensis subsp. rotundata TaxID=55577 RepID=A0AB40B6I2_DIOCR|nr:uncharacterized protein LOC120259362 isoform X2 [Dioscorea cayenensis subsp. rotundata]